MPNKNQSLTEKRELVTTRIYLGWNKNIACTANNLLKDVNAEMQRLFPDEYIKCSLSTIKRFLAEQKKSEVKKTEFYKPHINELLFGSSVASYDISESFIVKISYENAPLIAKLLMEIYSQEIVVTISHEFLVIYIINSNKNPSIKLEILDLFNLK